MHAQNCEKWRIASRCPSVCLSVCRHRTRLPLDGFSRNLIFEDISKICGKKNQVWLKSDKNNGYFTWRPKYILIKSRSVLLRMRNVSDTRCREIQNTHVGFSKFFRKAFCLWDNLEKKLYSRTAHRWQYGARKLQDGYLRLQTHTQNM